MEKFVNEARLRAMGIPYSGTHLRRLEKAGKFPRMDSTSRSVCYSTHPNRLLQKPCCNAWAS